MAALYYNENAGRAQAFTKEGIARYRLNYGRGHEGAAALAAYLSKPVPTVPSRNG